MGLLPSTEIASSLMLLAMAERYAEYCFGLERMLQPTQLCSQRQCGFSEIASSLALLAKTGEMRDCFAAPSLRSGLWLAMAEGGSK